MSAPADRPAAERGSTWSERSDTRSSPVFRAVWERSPPHELFQAGGDGQNAAMAGVMRQSLDVVRRHRDAGTLHDDREKLASCVLSDLATAGYWGLRVAPEFGGSGAALRDFFPFLSRMATISATVAGLASVHGCIGAAGAVSAFGTPEQKQRWLPALARGERYSAFALTEPHAGSDLTAIRTRADRTGDCYEVHGEKLFISNLDVGRTIVLICRIEAEPSALVCQLPDQENDTFRLRDYGLHALRRSVNRGACFGGLKVPVESRLVPARGNGLTVAYHGLNRGRVAVCALAAGQLRTMLASLIPWVHRRVTYGAPLAGRELIRRRLARLAALIVGCDALAAWCGGLLDNGYRGEMECTVAKVFGSEALKEGAIELMMKTHGGRSFLKGHWWGDNLYDYLTPCIYEGEGEILSLALFRTLVKPLVSPARAAGDGAAAPGSVASGPLAVEQRPSCGEFDAALDRARGELTATAAEIRQFVRGHGAAAADRQCQIVDLSQRVQKLLTLVVVGNYGAAASAEIVRLAAAVLASDLEREIQPRRAGDDDWRRVDRLGEWLADGGYRAWIDEPAPAILMPGE